jgi:hypothetical protein
MRYLAHQRRGQWQGEQRQLRRALDWHAWGGGGATVRGDSENMGGEAGTHQLVRCGCRDGACDIDRH